MSIYTSWDDLYISLVESLSDDDLTNNDFEYFIDNIQELMENNKLSPQDGLYKFIESTYYAKNPLKFKHHFKNIVGLFLKNGAIITKEIFDLLFIYRFDNDNIFNIYDDYVITTYDYYSIHKIIGLFIDIISDYYNNNNSIIQIVHNQLINSDFNKHITKNLITIICNYYGEFNEILFRYANWHEIKAKNIDLLEKYLITDLSSEKSKFMSIKYHSKYLLSNFQYNKYQDYYNDLKIYLYSINKRDSSNTEIRKYIETIDVIHDLDEDINFINNLFDVKYDRLSNIILYLTNHHDQQYFVDVLDFYVNIIELFNQYNSLLIGQTGFVTSTTLQSIFHPQQFIFFTHIIGARLLDIMGKYYNHKYIKIFMENFVSNVKWSQLPIMTYDEVIDSYHNKYYILLKSNSKFLQTEFK